MELLTKRLVWLYFALLVGEGVLRKWVTPGLSAPLLIVRDPVVIAIYVAAFMAGRPVIRGAVLVLVGLAAVSVVFAMLAEAPPFVTLYGLRVNYLHVPLIFVMADLLDRDDVIRYGRQILLLTLPITLLMIAQYFAGERSWLNAGAGGDVGMQLRGALGRVRPPGPFSFTSGPALWFPLATAFTVYGWLHREVYPRWLVLAATVAIMVAIPVSISRMLLLSVLLVVVMGGLTIARRPSRLLSIVVPIALIAILSGVLGGSEITESFSQRWTESTSSGIQHSIIDRVAGSYLGAIDMMDLAPLWGYGVGMGSNVGSRLSTGQAGFLLAEAEWSKIILELGPLLGWIFIGYRCWLTFKLFFTGLGQLFKESESLPWLLASASMLPVLSGQWGPPTILGFAVFGGGLTLAAANAGAEPEDEEDYEEEYDESEDGMDVAPDDPEEDLPAPNEVPHP